MTTQQPLQPILQVVQHYILQRTGARVNIKLNMEKEQEELELLFRAFQSATQQF